MSGVIRFVYELCTWLGVSLAVAATALVFRGCTAEAALWMIAAALLLIAGKDHSHKMVLQVITPGGDETEKESTNG